MNPGDLVFQPLAFDPKSACIALHELTMLRRPHFAHIGIYNGEGKMFTASGKVEMQDAGAVGNFAVPFAWNNWDVTQAWLQTQLGKPYDWAGWALAAIQPIMFMYRPAINPNTYMCSTLVAEALKRNDGSRFDSLAYRTATPDDIARAVGVI